MIGTRGRHLIRNFEGLRLDAYDDGTGVVTVGIGHTGGVPAGSVITEAQALEFFEEDLKEAEADLDRLISAELNEAQRDALASFFFNLGGGPRVAASELVRAVNEGQNFAASRAFLNWTLAGGRPMRGLLKRRLAEAALYAQDPWPQKG